MKVPQMKFEKQVFVVLGHEDTMKASLVQNIAFAPRYFFKILITITVIKHTRPFSIDKN